MARFPLSKASFALTFVTPQLLLPAWLRGLAGSTDKASRPLAIATLSLAFPAYAVVVGGDWRSMGRFLVPGFAFGALLIGMVGG